MIWNITLVNIFDVISIIALQNNTTTHFYRAFGLTQEYWHDHNIHERRIRTQVLRNSAYTRHIQLDFLSFLLFYSSGNLNSWW